MKNILFLMRYPLEDAYNLKQKFDGQMQSAVNLGYNVYHLAYDKKNIYLINVNKKSKEKICSATFGFLNAYRSTFGFYDLFKSLKIAMKTNHFNCIYMRSKIINSSALNIFKKYKSLGGKLIVEIPSYGSNEQVLSLIRVVIQKALSYWQKKLPQYVDLYTIIGTNDLKEYNDKPAICISNGVCVENYPLHQHKFNGELHILALASMRNWQGYDRLITGLAKYNGDLPVHIEMVGNDEDGSLSEWQKLAEQLGVSDKVHFRGACYGQDLTEIIDRCDLAAATLGLHRKSLGNASVLKVREYMARGIPFIYSYEDSCLSGNESFALKVSNNDSPVDINKLVDWAKTFTDKTSVAEEMRDFARKNMSWESQLSQSFKFVLGEN